MYPGKRFISKTNILKLSPKADLRTIYCNENVEIEFNND